MENPTLSRCLVVLGCCVVFAGCGTQPAVSPEPVADRTAIYVAPDGDNANPGTSGRPVQTLEHARDLARAMIPGAAGDITIYLEGGVYRLAEPLVLDARDSGANGHEVIYAAVAGQRPVLSGGVKVTGWQFFDMARNLWVAPAPAGLRNTRQLYVNGVRALRARGRLPVSLEETATGYTASSPVMAGWRNPSDIEFVYTGGNALWSERSVGLGPWTEPRCPVASIQGDVITMAQPCWDNSTKRVKLAPEFRSERTANLVGPASIGPEPAYVENAFELLGTPGQWYFDRTAGRIYYVPRPDEDLSRADVEVPVLEKLVVGEGTEDQPVHNLVFRGLQFSYATWLFPSSPEGFSEIQANVMVTGSRGYAVQGLGSLAPGGLQPYGAWTRTPGNVAFSYDRAIRFERDAFVHLGGAGLELGNGSQEDTVQGCIFTDVSANGLELGGMDLPLGNASQVTRDDRILDNRFTDIAAEFHGGVAIDVGYAQRTVIAHNQIDHIPYTGISIGWGGWPDKIRLPGVANNSRDNVIEDNLIFDHLLLLADGGGIYTQGLTGPDLASGEKVTGNVIRDQFSSGHAIYSDNGSCNMTISGNVIFRTNFDNWGSRHGDYYDGHHGEVYDPITVEHNWWQQGDPDSAERNITERDNRLITALIDAPAGVLAGAGLEPAYRDLLDRNFGAPAAPAPPSRVAAFAADGFAEVSWSPSIFNGGAPVDSYVVTSSRGQQATIAEADFRSQGFVSLSGLSNGTPYTFTVKAINANGASSPSLPSLPVTPSAGRVRIPSAPASVKVLARDGRASIHFQAAADDGGSPVTSYVVTIFPGERQVVFAGRSELVLSGAHATFGVVDGLQNGRAYVFSVAAVNAAGVGEAVTSKPVAVTP